MKLSTGTWFFFFFVASQEEAASDYTKVWANQESRATNLDRKVYWFLSARVLFCFVLNGNGLAKVDEI